MESDINWENTKIALENLSSIFSCSICGGDLSHPFSFELCKHYFCKDCAFECINDGLKCCHCNVVLWKEHMKINLELPEVVTICNELKTLLYKIDYRTEESENQKETVKTVDNEEGTYIFQPLGEGCSDEKKIVNSHLLLNCRDSNTAQIDTEENPRKSGEEKNKKIFKKKKKKHNHFENKGRKNDDYEMAINIPLNFETVNNACSDLATPPRSQFSNALSDQDIAQGAQKNPGRRVTKPKITYGKKSKHLYDSKLKRQKIETKPEIKEPGTKDEYAVFDFCSGTITECLNGKLKKPDCKEDSMEIKTQRKNGKKITTSSKRRTSDITVSEFEEPPKKTSKNIQMMSGNRKQSKANASKSKTLERRNTKGETALHTACIKGSIERVKELIELGAETNTKDFAGWTPLHEACIHGRLHIVQLLLDRGALLDCVGGEDNDTPLHDAVSNNQIDVVKLLLSYGAPTNVRNRLCLLPSDYAVTEDMKRHFAEATTRAMTNDVNISGILHNESNCSVYKVLLTTNLTPMRKKTVSDCCLMLEAKVIKDMNEKITHVVCDSDENGLCKNRTLKYLFGILTGKWIVSYQWVAESHRTKKWLPEIDYELKGLVDAPNNAPRRSRVNNLKTLPKLFDGCSFYFSGIFDDLLPKEMLIHLVKAGGGKILLREPKISDIEPLITPLSPTLHKLNLGYKNALSVKIYHAKETSSQACCAEYIIYDSKKNPGHKKVSSPIVCSAPVTWLLDCISSFEILDVRDEFEGKGGFSESQS